MNLDKITSRKQIIRMTTTAEFWLALHVRAAGLARRWSKCRWHNMARDAAKDAREYLAFYYAASIAAVH